MLSTCHCRSAPSLHLRIFVSFCQMSTVLHCIAIERPARRCAGSSSWHTNSRCARKRAKIPDEVEQGFLCNLHSKMHNFPALPVPRTPSVSQASRTKSLSFALVTSLAPAFGTGAPSTGCAVSWQQRRTRTSRFTCSSSCCIRNPHCRGSSRCTRG